MTATKREIGHKKARKYTKIKKETQGQVELKKVTKKHKEERLATKRHENTQKNEWTSINELCDLIRQTSFEIHKFLRSGHLEKVYENALIHRLTKSGLTVQQQCPIDVFDEDKTPLGHFVADLFVEETLIVEIKACRALIPEHVAQILGYLRASRFETGLLINFGAHKLQIKKYLLTHDD